jgi:biotin transporter BioY
MAARFESWNEFDRSLLGSAIFIGAGVLMLAGIAWLYFTMEARRSTLQKAGGTPHVTS